MSSISELQKLADKLTEVMPPTGQPLGIDRVDLRGGRWVVERSGVGTYTLRAEYQTSQGETVTLRPEIEMTGYPQTLLIALRLAIAVAESSRHYWQAI